MADDLIKGIQINSKGFGTISKLVMQDRNIDICAKALYAYFNSYSGGGDTCFPSRDKICYDLNITPARFSKYLKQLTQSGYIIVQQIKQKGKFSHNVYTICGEVPCVDFPYTEKPHTEKPYTENQPTNINSININNINNNNNNKKEKEKSAKGFDSIIADYTLDYGLQETIKDFIKMRQAKKKPMTDRSLKILLKKLDEMAKEDSELKIKLLEQSIFNSWLSIYPLKEETTGGQSNSSEPDESWGMVL